MRSKHLSMCAGYFAYVLKDPLSTRTAATQQGQQCWCIHQSKM